MQILILGTIYLPDAFIAANWLKYFDPALTISAGFTTFDQEHMDTYIKIMQDTGLTVHKQINLIQTSDLSKQAPDYLILITRGESISIPVLKKETMQKVVIDITNNIHMDDYTLSIELRDKIFQFYLNEIRGKEMLGADSCGAKCDIP